ncbi:MAG: PAS domain S-box protein [Candidatus Sumerlaeota bacterium]|nr:PAS domain S-box protein [Candidatus Sumerlaeota bacterium]
MASSSKKTRQAPRTGAPQSRPAPARRGAGPKIPSLEAVLGDFPIGVYRTTPEGRILYANAELVRMLGFDSFEELAQRNLEMEGFPTARERRRFRARMEKHGVARGTAAVWLKRDGTKIHVREFARALRDERGAIVGYEGVVEDITEQAQSWEENVAELSRANAQLAREVAEHARAADALQSSARMYRELIDQSADGVCVISPTGRILAVNSKSCEMSGYSEEEFLQLNVKSLIVPEDLERMPLQLQRAREQGPFLSERQVRRKDGSTFMIETHLAALRDGTFLANVRDITARKHMEEALRRHQKELEAVNRELIDARDRALESWRAKSRFLASMSHELRTPLNSIIGFSRLVLRHVGSQIPEKQSQNLRRILESAERLLALVNDVLDESRLEAGEMQAFPEEFPLRPLIEEAAHSVQPQMRANGNRLSVAYSGDELACLRTDRGKVRQILLNLLGNAAKFCEQGQVRLRVGIEPRDEAAAANAPGPMIAIAVDDEGIGMTPEQLAHVFEAFRQADDSTTRKYGGTGLGLAISRSLARLLGGDIAAVSEPGRGSTFTLRFPAALPAESARG